MSKRTDVRQRAPRSRSRVHALGDAALYVELGSRLDPALSSRALNLAGALRRRRGVHEVVAGHASVTVHFDPDAVNLRALTSDIEALLAHRPPPSPPGRLHRVPVIYDGPDLEAVAAATGLAPGDVVRLHCAPIYRVFMLGFVPGWAYLGVLPQELRLPRRDAPRSVVAAGSVGIAEAQTGIYPLPSPGGWHLVGRTRLRTFLPDSDPPALFRAGDRVRFFPLEEPVS